MLKSTRETLLELISLSYSARVSRLLKLRLPDLAQLAIETGYNNHIRVPTKTKIHKTKLVVGILELSTLSTDRNVNVARRYVADIVLQQHRASIMALSEEEVLVRAEELLAKARGVEVSIMKQSGESLSWVRRLIKTRADVSTICPAASLLLDTSRKGAVYLYLNFLSTTDLNHFTPLVRKLTTECSEFLALNAPPYVLPREMLIPKLS